MEEPIDVRPKPPLASRIFFFVAGILALGIGTLITLGAALAGAVSIGIAVWLLRRKGQRLTRRGAWLSSVGGTIGVLAVLLAYAVLSGDNATRPPSAAERAAQREKATQAMPDWLRAMNPNAQKQTAQADSIAGKLLDNKAVMIWAGLMGAVIGAAMIGTIAGSFAWGGVMLLFRSFYGDWMPAAGDPEPATGL